MKCFLLKIINIVFLPFNSNPPTPSLPIPSLIKEKERAREREFYLLYTAVSEKRSTVLATR